jgi:hypothetical protein
MMRCNSYHTQIHRSERKKVYPFIHRRCCCCKQQKKTFFVVVVVVVVVVVESNTEVNTNAHKQTKHQTKA